MSKDFGGLHALQAIDLDVMTGEIVGIIGPNGSGKTTFFNVLSGIHPATSGTHPLRRACQHHPPAAASRHPLRHRPHIPEPAPVQPDDRAGERARRHGVAHAGGAACDHAGTARRACREGRGGAACTGTAGTVRVATRATHGSPGVLAVLRQPTAPGDRARTRHRSASAAAGRTGRRHEPERDARTDGRHPAHPRHSA